MRAGKTGVPAPIAGYSLQRTRGSVPPIVMRRAMFPTIAVLTVIAQLALGISAHLGLVLCVGEDHAAIELASDDCCESHGSTGTKAAPVVPTIERECCSDTPLYALARTPSDVPRGSYAPVTSLGAAPALGLAALTIPGSAVAVDPADSPPAITVSRSVVLRV